MNERRILMENKNTVMTGRKCYDHLGGKLGAKLLDYLIQNKMIELERDKKTVYVITKKGEEWFQEIGLNI
jgi:predicted transcriptional regulator